MAWIVYAVASIAGYLTLQAILRFRRRDETQRRFPTRASLQSMTLDDAYPIQVQLAEQEFPSIFSTSVFFALFKTYGIPSISKLLVATGQLANEGTASKRAADTGVLLTEIVLHHPQDKRSLEGIARMNFLHNRYRHTGKISDEDVLYTLSLFILEPIRWTDQFEWRPLTDVERCAMGVYWRWMGAAMEVPLTALKGSAPGWTDGLDFLESLIEWSRDYEVKHMVPAETNKVMGAGTLTIAMTNVPVALRPLALAFASSLLDTRLRTAMMLQEPPRLVQSILTTVIGLRKMVVRYLLLPRPRFLRRRWHSEKPDRYGFIHAEQYVAHPWYVRPSTSRSYGPKALLLRLAGGFLPGDEGDRFCPQGYRIPEVGPKPLVGKGISEMATDVDRMSELASKGCPMFGREP